MRAGLSDKADCVPQFGPRYRFDQRNCSVHQDPLFRMRGDPNAKMYLLLPMIVHSQSHKISNIVCQKRTFFLDGKNQLVCIGQARAPQFVHRNGVNSSCPQRFCQTGPDIFV